MATPDHATESCRAGFLSLERRQLQDVIMKAKHCGFDTSGNLQQIVVCGAKGAGKTSVLEALMGIRLPLDTRMATEIVFKRKSGVPISQIVVQIRPSHGRKHESLQVLLKYLEVIQDFSQLSDALCRAMGFIHGVSSTCGEPYVWPDILDVVVSGPNQPDLRIVDLPGPMAHSESPDNHAWAMAMTQHWLKSPNTICLAVVSAQHDVQGVQPFLSTIQELDPTGERTIGIVTHVDHLGKEVAPEGYFASLARNERFPLPHGWNVIRNLKREEWFNTPGSRNQIDMEFIDGSAFKDLNPDRLGIEALRSRLAQILFSREKHQHDIAQLREKLNNERWTSRNRALYLHNGPATPAECRVYLTDVSKQYSSICKAALLGKHDDNSSREGSATSESSTWPTPDRLRARVQYANDFFAKKFCRYGQTYWFRESANHDYATFSDDGFANDEMVTEVAEYRDPVDIEAGPEYGTVIDDDQAADWIKNSLSLNDRTDLPMVISPQDIAMLLRKQTQAWQSLALEHIHNIHHIIERFIQGVMEASSSKGVAGIVWDYIFDVNLRKRRTAADKELARLIEDLRHSLTVPKSSWKMDVLCIEDDGLDYAEILRHFQAIYKIQRDAFVTNVNTQVIERHMIRGLDQIFTPQVVADLDDEDVVAFAGEPPAKTKERAALVERIKLLEETLKGLDELMVG